MKLAITLDCVDPVALAPFWRAVLGYDEGRSGDVYVILVGDGPPFLLQRVAEPKVAKNRMHLDVHHDDVDAEVARLVGLGAARLGAYEQDGHRWVILADPEGNEFCVCETAELDDYC